MAFVGMYIGPFFSIMELQARWACQVFKKVISSPSKEEMNLGLEEAKKIREIDPQPQFPFGDYIGLGDSIAKEMGYLPSFSELQTKDEKLYCQLWNGPYLPSHNRLTGFGNNPEIAKKVIDEVDNLMN